MEMLVHPDQEPADPSGHRPDDGTEPGPSIGIYIVEAVTDPAQAIGLHRPGVYRVAESAAGRERHAETDIRSVRTLACGRRRGCRRSADAAARGVEGQHASDEILRLDCSPLQRTADGLGL